MKYIGIDGGKKTGYCVYDPDKGIEDLLTLDFWTAYEQVMLHWPDDTVIMIEDPEQNRPVFEKGISGKKLRKVSQNVGGVKRESRLLIEGLRRAGYAVIGVKPTTGKWSANFFKKVTGWTGQTSEHARDAAKLVYGKPPMRITEINRHRQNWGSI